MHVYVLAWYASISVLLLPKYCRYSHKVQNLTSNSTSAKSQGFAPPEYATPDVGVQRIGETR